MRICSVNVGQARPVRMGGRHILTAIGKSAVSGPVAVTRLGLAGDEQADLSIHGGLDKAVYAYPVEHRAFWEAQLLEQAQGLFAQALPPGFMGENLSVEGLLEHEVWIGDHLHIGSCVLRVTAPREPCFKLSSVLGLPHAGRLMVERSCPGFYLAVEQAGSIEAGQTFRLEPGTRGLSVAAAFAARRIKHLR